MRSRPELRMATWQQNRRQSLKTGSNSSIEIERQDCDSDLMYGDTERPSDPMEYVPGENGKGKKEEQ